LLQKLAAQLLQFPALRVVIGHPLAREGQRYNAASLLANGVVQGTYCKHDLPNYDVFDEQRYFTPDNRPFVFDINGTAFGINICEDTWFAYTPECAQAAGAQVLVSRFAFPSAKAATTLESCGKRRVQARDKYAPGGGQDELVFDGASFVLDASGELVASAPHFEEALLIVDFVNGAPRRGSIDAQPGLEALAYSALVLGVRDYLGKNGFPGAIIGLSGGVDSALTLTIAVDALGAGRVRAVMMPSQFTAQMSLDDATDCTPLGVRYDVLPIKPAFDASWRRWHEIPRTALGHDQENLRAHIRHAADGAVQQVRLDRADDRQQVRDRGRLFHAVRRSRRRLCRHQGHPEDIRLPPLPLPEFDRAGDPGTHPDARAERGTEKSETRTRCRRTTCSTRSSSSTCRKGTRSRTSLAPATTRTSCARSSG
jgi:NAD+ synthase (glutamine-hydrolysing)